ncbi:hypothetical protein [Caulobacter sp. RHG1]|uniref:hypothetical protein n=1 Tax=Caulobacter sp. (strain RHG1) TaxID=2545762 RepID=UPI00155378E2|nr:hypothetical protein [Caulobacter sp. RHG1]NQE60594.1 hypothetical protein [Caulobacter sp. RHG1]
MRVPQTLGGLLIACLAIVVPPARAQAPVPPPPAWSPNLDCAARVYAVDTLICEDPGLLEGARQVEAAYRRATALSPDSLDALQVDQLEWSKQRNMCVFERGARGCVKRLQARRAKALAASPKATTGR